MKATKLTSIAEYIASFPPEIQEKLKHVREAIKSAAPKAEETINYGIPTFKLNGNLVHFGGFKTHTGFYPGPGALEKFKDEIMIYESGKGSVQFPYTEPMPLDLIRRITEFRVKEQLAKVKK